MLTLMEKVRLLLKHPRTLGWEWKAQELITELREAIQKPSLPSRIRALYTKAVFELLIEMEKLNMEMEDNDVI